MVPVGAGHHGQSAEKLVDCRQPDDGAHRGSATQLAVLCVRLHGLAVGVDERRRLLRVGGRAVRRPRRIGASLPDGVRREYQGERKLTEQHERFAVEFVRTGSAKSAAIVAGVEVHFAARQGVAWLGWAEIQDRIKVLRAERSARLALTDDRIIQELAVLAFYDAGEIGAYEIKGPQDIQHLPEHVRRAVVGWKWDRNGNFEIKLAPKMAALQALGQHYGLFDGKPAQPEELKAEEAKVLKRREESKAALLRLMQQAARPEPLVLNAERAVASDDQETDG